MTRLRGMEGAEREMRRSRVGEREREGMDGEFRREAKRPRRMAAWEIEDRGLEGNRLGLSELFFHAPPDDRDNERWGSGGGQGQFTFRLEHRDGGAMARHHGEERILLFRSDRPGAIAKIIYSSEGAPARKPPASSKGGKEENEYDEDELRQMAQAKIHVLDVKEPYRGRDLGGLLFSEAVQSLRNRYDGDDDEESQESEDVAAASLSHSVRCQLDAEEDIRRHNKLVGFYEALGCRVKPKAKIRYLNNNDGEMYRKIPMQVALQSTKHRTELACSAPVHGEQKRSVATHKPTHRHHVTNAARSLVGLRGGFLPIQLFASTGHRVDLPVPRRVDWILVDEGGDGIQIRTTQGHRVVATDDGRVATLSPEDGYDLECGDVSKCAPTCAFSNDWGNFFLCRVPDSGALSGGETTDNDEPEGATRGKELWMFKSPHGTYLSADPVTHTLACTEVPAFWQANDNNLSLTCTTDTPPRRIHYRNTWRLQGVDYVQEMRARYLSFGLCRMTILDALDKAKDLPCYPFRVRRESGPSLRTFCFRAAEAVRQAGYPDWMQIVAFVHELGRLVACVDPAAAACAEAGYDWTVSSRSRVIGCMPPERASFREFRNLNPDRYDEQYNTPLGMYEEHTGLDNLLLTWSGPEYVYHMLRHNGVALPEEGLAMVRYFPLGDWHVHSEYRDMTNDEDEDMKPFVSDFDLIRRQVRKSCDIGDLTDAECMWLWERYFANTFAKYCCDGDLFW